jgi:hypothetical protein
MCATGGQQALGTAETAAYNQAATLTAQQYANQQAIYQPMIAKFQSIFNAGPSQEGFSASELQDLNSQAVEGTAENYQGAAKAVGEQTAAEGGGTNPLPSGAQTQLKEQVATSAAQNESQQETQIKGADYAQGFQNYENAAGGLESIAAGENPLGYENAESNLGNTANQEENAIAQEDTGWESAAFGVLGQAAGQIPWSKLGGGGGGSGGSSGGDSGIDDTSDFWDDGG